MPLIKNCLKLMLKTCILLQVENKIIITYRRQHIKAVTGDSPFRPDLDPISFSFICRTHSGNLLRSEQLYPSFVYSLNSNDVSTFSPSVKQSFTCKMYVLFDLSCNSSLRTLKQDLHAHL